MFLSCVNYLTRQDKDKDNVALQGRKLRYLTPQPLTCTFAHHFSALISLILLISDTQASLASLARLGQFSCYHVWRNNLKWNPCMHLHHIRRSTNLWKLCSEGGLFQKEIPPPPPPPPLMLGLCCSKELEAEAELEVALREDALCAAHASYSSRYCKARKFEQDDFRVPT